MNLITMWKSRQIFNYCQAIYENNYQGYSGVLYEDDRIKVFVYHEYLPSRSKSGKGYDFCVYLRGEGDRKLVYSYCVYHPQGNTGWEDHLKAVAERSRQELAVKKKAWKEYSKEQRRLNHAPL